MATGLALGACVAVAACSGAPVATLGASQRAGTVARDLSEMGLVPENCPSVPKASHVLGGYGAGFGMYPVWSIGFADGQPASVQLDPSFAKDGKALRKVLFVVDPSYGEPVELSGRDASSGASLWFFGYDDRSASQPRERVTLEVHGGANNFTGYIGADHAGCYMLEAKWHGGVWSVTIPVGR